MHVILSWQNVSQLVLAFYGWLLKGAQKRYVTQKLFLLADDHVDDNDDTNSDDILRSKLHLYFMFMVINISKVRILNFKNTQCSKVRILIKHYHQISILISRAINWSWTVNFKQCIYVLDGKRVSGGSEPSLQWPAALPCPAVCAWISHR